MPYSLPYAPERLYDYGPSRTLGDLMRRRADVQAQQQLRSGEIAAQAWQNVGNAISGTLGQLAQYQLEAPERELARREREARIAATEAQAAQRAADVDKEQRLNRQDTAFMGLVQMYGDQPIPPKEILAIYGPQRGAAIAQGMQALNATPDPKDVAAQATVVRDVMRGLHSLSPELRAAAYPAARQTLIGKGMIRAQDAPEQYDDAWWTRTVNYGVQPAAAPKPERVEVTNPDGSKTVRWVVPSTETTITSAAPKKDPIHVGNQLVDADTLQPVYTAPTQGPAPARTPVWVVDPQGNFRDLAGVAPPGSKPANTREQGRPVIAGDAEDIAAIDEGLALANGLTFKQGDTGIVPSVTGALPDAITNLTGIGVEAKSRQGVINLVKQIIGKGLEGGVLRKEDESKYAKILPTLSDHPTVVEAKIKNLKTTLEQKRTIRLDALDDAGYDVSRFRTRTPASPKAGGMVTMRAPDGSTKPVPADQVEHYTKLGATVVERD